ncbi:MAG TPA: kelch repeat-containing protein, partial [Candidatus Acidoferrales bacterium]|nr:kelch repeat-containing protein [Candidatus Acidoferrales bacterium]
MKPSVKSVLIGAVILTVIAAVLHGSPLVISSGTWQATGVLSNARSGAAASLLSDGRILVTGGNSTAGSLASADFFNADGSITAAPPMVYSRAGQVSVTLQDGRVLVAGGVTAGGSATSTAEIFDPVANSWSMAAGAMTEARAGATAAVLQDGRVVLAGGQNGSTISSTVEIFDPTTGAFTSVGMMSSPRTQHAMTVLHDGRALIVGGFNGSGPVATTDIFDPAVGTISAGPALSVARFSHSATTLLNGVVAVIGGNNGNADPQQADAAPTEIFDPSSAAPAFSTIAAMPATPREGHAAILLPNNNSILIMGGTSAGATVASAELFTAQDSAAGIWSYGFTSTGAMSVARSNVSAAANQSNAPSTTMQRRGVLMVAGGNDANGNALNTTEAYGYPLVQTDLGDYPPGSVVTITGSGFQPGETVTIQLIESPLLDTHGPYTAVADANGNFLDTDFVTDPYDLNIRFFLTATGAASGLIAQNTFTDATATNTTLSSNPNPSNLNQSVTLTATVRNGNVQGSGTLVTVGSVTFFDQTGINNPNCSGNTGANLGNSAVSGSGTATISHSFTVSGARKLGACYNGTGGQGTQNSQSPSITQTVNSDATPPVVTITFPAPVHGTNGWFNAQDTVPVVGSVSATDSSNVSSISCSDSAGGLAQGALSGGGTTTATASLTVSGDGTHNISCTATDGAGNNGAAAGSTAMPVVVKIDTQAPTGVTGAATRPADHNGWFTSAVMINFSGNDPTSGISSCTSTNYSGPDSASASVSGHCTDNAGNQSSDVPFNFKYDATAPTAVSLSVTAGTAGTNGWYTSDVTVHTSGTELVSLPLSCTPDQFQTAETTGQVFNGSCTNDAGLSANAAPLTIKLDKTGPTATLNATGTFGNNGWYTSNVTISTTGSDTISNPTTCTADQTQTTDTTGQTFNGSCTNDAGLKTDATPLTIKRDATPPTVIITPDRSADHNGWYNHALTFTNPGTDATSGIASCTVPATYTAPDTATASVSADCTDNAGNVGHGSFGFKFDATAPANVTVSADRTPDSNGWYNHAITVTWTGTDPVSGIDTCTKTPYSGPDNGSASLSGSCTDVAGNTSTSVAFNFEYDATPPTVAITPDRSADHNGWYNHALTFTNPGTDATSGIASCTVPATYTAPDTATASVSADCTDNAGNVGHGSFNFKFDATAPTNVTVSADRTPDSNGWYNHALTVTWNGTDATSGIDSCTKTPYGGPDNGGASLPGTCT